MDGIGVVLLRETLLLRAFGQRAAARRSLQKMAHEAMPKLAHHGVLPISTSLSVPALSGAVFFPSIGEYHESDAVDAYAVDDDEPANAAADAGAESADSTKYPSCELASQHVLHLDRKSNDAAAAAAPAFAAGTDRQWTQGLTKL